MSAVGLVEEKAKCEGLTRVVTPDNNLTGENRTGKEATGCISKVEGGARVSILSESMGQRGMKHEEPGDSTGKRSYI